MRRLICDWIAIRDLLGTGFVCGTKGKVGVSKQDDTLTLFLAQRAALVRLAEGILGNSAEAEDVVQEAWLRFSRLAASRSLTEPMGYLRMIVRNLALDGSRRQRVEARIFQPGADAEAIVVASDLPSPEAQAISSAQLALTRLALEEMPESMRIAVEMHRLGGRKLREIAAHLGVSVTTAHTLVADGIERCRIRASRKPG